MTVEQLSLDAARQARDAAIATADAHADPEWKAVAYGVVRGLAALGEPFTADDVWDRLPETVDTHEPAALGPVMLRASKARLIVKTGRLVATRHPRRHRDLVEWCGR